jgi:hypothetical protein
MANQTLSTVVPPYTWMDTINLNVDTAWTCPDTLKVLEVRFQKPGTYAMRLTRSARRPYLADSCDIIRVDLRNIYKNGTDSVCRFGSVKVFGIRK